MNRYTSQMKEKRQCDQIRRNFAALTKSSNNLGILRVYLVSGKMLNPLWANLEKCSSHLVTLKRDRGKATERGG